MCYFHVTSNVIKNYCKYNVPLDKRKQINGEIYYLHESRDYTEIRKVIIKSNKLNKAQFFRLDFNNIRFDSKSKKTGLPYSHFIRICGPVYCCCSTFVDLAYCHHILAIIKFELADIILDPLYVKPAEPRRLAVNTKRGRPKHFSGKALQFDN
jgi:hypothetical protein